jgi:hypothetical protein
MTEPGMQGMGYGQPAPYETAHRMERDEYRYGGIPLGSDPRE